MKPRIYPASLVVGCLIRQSGKNPDKVVRFDPPLPWGRAFHRCRTAYPKAGLHPVMELRALPEGAELW